MCPSTAKQAIAVHQRVLSLALHAAWQLEPSRSAASKQPPKLPELPEPPYQAAYQQEQTCCWSSYKQGVHYSCMLQPVRHAGKGYAKGHPHWSSGCCSTAAGAQRKGAAGGTHHPHEDPEHPVTYVTWVSFPMGIAVGMVGMCPGDTGYQALVIPWTPFLCPIPPCPCLMGAC